MKSQERAYSTKEVSHTLGIGDSIHGKRVLISGQSSFDERH